MNTSGFFGDFPAFFVGGPLTVLVKKPCFSPRWAHIALHKTQSCLFGYFPAFFVEGPLSVLLKTFTFSLHAHRLPFINTSCFFHVFTGDLVSSKSKYREMMNKVMPSLLWCLHLQLNICHINIHLNTHLWVVPIVIGFKFCVLLLLCRVEAIYCLGSPPVTLFILVFFGLPSVCSTQTQFLTCYSYLWTHMYIPGFSRMSVLHGRYLFCAPCCDLATYAAMEPLWYGFPTCYHFRLGVYNKDHTNKVPNSD